MYSTPRKKKKRPKQVCVWDRKKHENQGSKQPMLSRVLFCWFYGGQLQTARNHLEG